MRPVARPRPRIGTQISQISTDSEGRTETSRVRSPTQPVANLHYSRRKFAHAAQIFDGLETSVPRRGFTSQPRVATQERTLGNRPREAQP